MTQPINEDWDHRDDSLRAIELGASPKTYMRAGVAGDATPALCRKVRLEFPAEPEQLVQIA